MELIQNFKNFLLLQKPAPSQVTVKNYLADVKHFIVWYESFLSKPFQPSEATLTLINQFRSQKAATYSVRSIERHISSLRKFFHALKLQGAIARSPFDEIPSGAPRTNQDPWRLKEFKDFLYVYNASRLTIKNYIIDVKQFLKWIEEISGAEDAARVNEKNVFSSISSSLLEEYKQRLLETGTFSATSINRKLSSLRKYLSWAGAQGYLSTQVAIPDNLNNNINSISVEEEILPKIDINTYQNTSTIQHAHEKEEKMFVYSKFPPLRIIQKVGKIADLGVEALIITPLTKVVILVHKQLWKLQGKKLFVADKRLAQSLPQPRFTPYVENIKKAIYAPHAISLKYFPWYKKAIHHARYTRPDWYRKYHTYALAHYFNWAILIVFCTAIGFGMYNSFIAKPTDKPTLAASAPPRILSFQGRLTDSADSPITASTNLRFAIYSDATSSGSALLWQEVNGVIPDKNGVFSVLLGKGTTIPQSLFANNQNLYLGVSVGATTELTPRQQLATVAYASNAETLQGLPPITQSGAGTTNVILALNSSGNLSVGASTTFQSTTGQFAIAGNTVALSTNPGSNGNITLTPDGSGFIDLQKPLQNSSLNNNVAPGLGALEVDDLFAVLATSAASSVIVNQNGSGALFTASTAGVTKFTVGNAGDITSANYTTNGGVLYTNGNGLFLQTSAGAVGNCLTSNGGGAPIWGTCGGGTNYWNLTSGTLSPINSTLDVFFGGSATNSANFAFINNAGGTPTASIAGNLTLNSAGTIQTTRNQALTIGGSTTGNIILSPNNGSGFITINGSFNSNILPAATNNFDLGSNTLRWNNLYVNNIFSNGQLITQLLQRNAGVLAPLNTTDDLAVGGIATGSAKFQIFGNTGNATTAGSLTFNASGNLIQTTNNQPLIIGGTTTGGITLSPNNGSGTVTIAGLGTGVVHSTNGILSTTTVALTSEVSGTLPISHGGTNTTTIGATGGVAYSNGTNYAFTGAGSLGDCLVSNGSSAPSWSLCSTAAGASNYWTLDSGLGVLYPINTTLDVFFGGTSTASAKFAFLNNGAGIPTASISGNLTLNSAGTIQTTRNQALTIGGSTTGNIILSPNNGSGFITINGSFNSNLSPAITDTYDLGTASLEWNTIYVKNIVSSGTISGFFQRSLGVIAPTNITDDLAIGGTATGSAKFQIFGNTGNATTSGNLTFNGNGAIQTTNNQPLTLGGNATGAITLSPNNGSGTVTINGSALQTTASTFNAFTTNATNLGLGVTGGTTTVNSALTITGTITPNGQLAASLIPQSTSINLGGSSNYYGSAYITNLFPSNSSVYQGFWQLNSGSLSPINITNDLLIGGTATGAAKFQIFGNTGNATTSGNLTFNGNGAIQTTNNQPLTLGGTTTGNIILSPNNGIGIVTVNGRFNSSLIPSVTNTYDLGSSNLQWNTVYANNVLINGQSISQDWQRNLGVLAPSNISDNVAIGGTSTASAKFMIFGNTGNATTAGNLTFSTSGNIQTTSNQPLTLGGNTTGNIILSPNNGSGTVTINGTTLATASIIPQSTTVNLGSAANNFGTLYATNISLPSSGGIGGYWQLNAGALSPTNIANDMLVGGTATSSAKFQIFGNTGNATTSGTLTFNGSGNLIQTTNNQALTIGGSTTGAVTVSANNGTGTVSLAAATVALTGTTPTVTTLSNNALSILAGTGTITLGTNATGGDIQFFNSSNKITNAGALTIASNLTVNGTGSSFIAGRLGIGVTPLTGTALDVEKDSLGNAGAIFANLNTTGDLLTASNSAATQFIVTNGGVVKARSFQDLDNTSYLLDPASTGNSLLIAGTAGIGTLNPLSSSGLDIEKNALGNAALVVANLNLAGDLFTASNSAGTKFTIANNGTISKTGYTTSGGILFTNGTGTVSQTASGNLGECLTSAAGGTPVWAACATGSAGTNYWTMANGALYPINSTFDLFAGGNSTASAKFAVLNMASGTPVASVSSGLNGTALFMAADGSIQTATANTLTIGGTTTGNIALSPQNGLGKVTVNGAALDGNSAGFTLLATPTNLSFGGSASTLTIGATTGTTTFRNPTIDDSTATVTLFGTPTSLTFGGAATTLNIGKSGGTTTVLGAASVNGNTTLGTNATNTITSNGLYNTDIVPTGNGSINLGSSLHYYNTVYANNFVAPVGSGTAGYWAVSNDVLFPVNTFYDLTVGGTATGSATPWQVFSQTLGVDTAGTATSSGGLSFRGANTNVNLLNGSVLKVQTSVGGDEGLTGHTQMQLDNNGDLTLGGANIKTTQGTVALFDTTATTLNIGGAATTGVNLGNATGATLLRGNLTLGSSNTNTIFPNGKFSASIVPTSTSINLGDSSSYFGSVFATNIFMASNAQYSGFWQINNKVLSPVDAGNYDLAIGGTATSSAKFQIFGTNGNASTSGNLTFSGTSTNITALNGSNITFNTSVGGDGGSASKFSILNSGSLQLTSTGTKIYFNNGTGDYLGSGKNNDLTLLTQSSWLRLSGGNGIAFWGNNNGASDNNPNAFLSGTGSFGIGTFSPLTSTGLDIEKNSLGNAALVINQQGTGDILTASTSGTTKFTIANDGTIKNSLIPNATDTYSLGSDPTIGGKEWDTLYVRQIVTPSNGGLAGFWQLSNAGVLAPANTTNDLVIGGNATASARFQIFGSGVNVGTITMKPNDPQVNSNAGTLPAASKVINIASTDHTYMTLDNKDLIIGGHKSMQSSISNVQKVFIYDTSKDSDGGRWTNDERAQVSSWYNEAATAADTCSINTNARCGQQVFPRKAIIAVTSGTTGAMYIFDAKDNSLWMRFDKGATTTENMVGPITNDPGSSVAALNGKIYFATGGLSGSAGALYVIDFNKDSSYKYNDSGYYVGSNTIKNRNTQDTYNFYANVYGSLSPAGFANRFIDVAVNVINGQTFIAGATRSGVALYNESTQTLVGTFDTVGIASNVALTSTGDLYATMCIDGSNPCGHYVLKVKHNIQNTAFGTNKTFDEVYGYNSLSNYGVTRTDNNTFSSITFTAGPSATTSANFVPPVANGLYVTQGTSTVDGTSNTIYLAATGSGGSLAVIQEKKGDPSNGSIKYYNSNYITEDMVGDIRGMWPFNETSGNLLDASVRGITLTASSSGVTYSASGVRGNALTFDGSSGFVYCTNSNCGGISDLGIDGTQKKITVGAWVKTSASGARQVIISKWNNNVGGSYLLTVESTGKVMWALNGLTTNVTSVRTVNDGNWHHIVGTYDGANQLLYIDGQIDGQQAKTLAFASSTIDFLIGAYLATNNYAGWFNGSIDEPFVSASVLNGGEIDHIYQVGYRAVQNHSSKTIRSVVTGSDSNQKIINGNSNVSAVAANMQNGEIYIGTQGGGTSVIGMDSDTLTDIYSSGINTKDDAGTAWSASSNNNYVQSISAGQSYGNGTALVIGNSNSGTGNTWMETQDTSLKEVLASSYNPFGSSLTQSNLSVDSVLRVTNQLSTRLDNLAFGATSSAQFADAFRVDSNGNLLSRSLVNSSTAMQFEDANGNNYLRINTAAGTTDTAFNFLQPGSGDIMIASNSALTEFQLTNSGVLRARAFQDLDNTSYFLDPASTGNSLITAGEATIGTPTGSASAMLGVIGPDTNGTDAFHVTDSLQSGYLFASYRSTGTAVPYAQIGAWSTSNNSFGNFVIPGGNVGIGTTSPGALLDVNIGNAASVGIRATGTSAPEIQVSRTTGTLGTLDLGITNGNGWFFNSGVTQGDSVIRFLSGTSLQIGHNSSGSPDVTVNSSGYVGIGATAPVQKLDVRGMVTASEGLPGSPCSNNTGGFSFWQDGCQDTGMYSDADGVIKFYTNNVNAVTLANGHVGVDNTNPGNWILAVKGNGPPGAQLLLQNSNGGAGYGLGPDNSNNNMVVYDQGTGCGGVYMLAGGQVWNSRCSDQRVKKDVASLPNTLGLEGIRQLNPVSFHWNLASDSGQLHWGLIAQQVQPIYPYLTLNEGDQTKIMPDGTSQTFHNFMTVDYQDLIFPAIIAIKELDASNSATLGMVNQLQGLELNHTGDVAIINATPSANFTIPSYYTLNDALGNPISRMGAFVELVVGNLRAGSVSTQQLFTNSLALATTNITIAGQSLHDYILSVVQSAGYSSSQVAQSDSVKTNIISPLSGGNVALRLTNSGIEVAKDASSSAVAGIDNNGNATFSGSLNSQNLAVNGDASVSGTLRAGRIEANTIAGLQAVVGTLSAQNITNVTNIYFATQSATLAGENTITGSNSISSTTSGALTPQIGYANIASYSGFLAYVPNLSAATGTFSQNLTSTGTTSLSDTTISGQLAIGTQLILADNSINVLGGTFQIQSLAQGDVSFEGGLIAIDTNGNLTVNGNAVFAKNLAANVITPLANDRDLTFKLGDNSASGSALATSTLAVQNASGSGIFNIDQLGNVIASGAANIAKLNFNAVEPALAVSDTEIVATGSAGTAAIKAHQTEVTIDNPLVTAKSLIYITPVGQTNYTPYLLRQVEGKSFTVGIPVQQYVGTTFNWLIVN